MKPGWEVKKLGEVCEFEGGSQPPKSQFSYTERADYVRFLQIRDFATDKNITYIPHSKKNRLCLTTDILIGRYGASVGKILSGKSGAYNVALMKTKPDLTVLDGTWFYYYLISDTFQSRLGDISARSAQAGFSKEDISGFPVPVPPLAEQQRIVAFLDEAFAGIATARAKAEKNLQNARALFESHLNAVFTQRGDGWVEKRLGDICKFENGDRGKNYPNKHEYVDSGIPWINTGHIQRDGSLSLSSMNYISRDKFNSLRSGKIQPGDLVYCLRGATLGKTALVDPYTEGAVASSLVILRPSIQLNRKYLYFFLTSPLGQGLIKGFENGAAQPNLGAKSVAMYMIPLPSIAEQTAIVDALDDLREQTQRLESIFQRKIAALDELKKSLLHEAFSGEA